MNHAYISKRRKKKNSLTHAFFPRLLNYVLHLILKYIKGQIDKVFSEK